MFDTIHMLNLFEGRLLSRAKAYQAIERAGQLTDTELVHFEFVMDLLADVVAVRKQLHDDAIEGLKQQVVEAGVNHLVPAETLFPTTPVTTGDSAWHDSDESETHHPSNVTPKRPRWLYPVEETPDDTSDPT